MARDEEVRRRDEAVTDGEGRVLFSDTAVLFGDGLVIGGDSVFGVSGVDWAGAWACGARSTECLEGDEEQASRTDAEVRRCRSRRGRDAARAAVIGRSGRKVSATVRACGSRGDRRASGTLRSESVGLGRAGSVVRAKLE
jgi:hypothetical protein